MITLGIIGFGGIAKSSIHMGEIKNRKDCFVKAVADVNVNEEAVKEFGIPQWYNDYNELLADPEIDAVLIATPHHLHEEQAVAAFRAGKHVLIEKPISRNLKEAQNIIDAAKKAGKIGMIGFCERFDPKHADMKNRVESGQLGEILSVRTDHYQNFLVWENSWWRDADKVGGGAVIGSGIHRLDLLRWMVGDVAKVYASAVNMPERMSAETCVHAVLEFKNGAVGNFSINWASYNFLYYEGLSISGKDGLIVARDNPFTYKMGRFDNNNGVLQDLSAPAYQTMYDHFLDCIRNNRTPMTSLEEGYKSLQVVRAIYKSIETGAPVIVDEVDF